jgi:O-glycosyl hydrolase
MMMRLDPSTDVLAGPWSAEPWMKANDAWDNLNFAGTLLPGAYQPFADEFVKFIRGYASAGVPISAVTPMNEGGTPSEYPGTTLEEPAFVTSYLVPTLRAARLRTRVYDLDGSGFSGEEQWLANPSYRATIAGTAVHCYAGLEQMSKLHALNPSGSLIMSECSPNHSAYPPAEIAIVSARNYAQAVDFWNIALDPAGGPKQPVPGCDHCGALVTVDEDAHRATLTRSYYEFGQLARFVRRGAIRIASNHWASDFVDSSTGGYGVTAGLDDVAFLNPDGTKVLIAYNNSNARIRFQVTFHGRGFAYSLGGHATATFTWR